MEKLVNSFNTTKTADFVRKACDLQEMETLISQGEYIEENYIIDEVWEMSVSEMRNFKNDFFSDYDFIKGKGGRCEVAGKIVVSAILVVCTNMDWFVVNPEGYGYSRYIAKF
jgi:hypothetical protein